MGQAKSRGTLIERINFAKDKSKTLIPREIECVECGAIISKIEGLESRPLIGVTSAYVGNCTICNSNTIGMTGDPERVRYYMNLFSRSLSANYSDL